MKRAIIYLVINYLILSICWTMMRPYFIFHNNNFLQMVAVMAALIQCAFCIGVECIIYCMFTIKETNKNITIMFGISMIINVLLISFDNGLLQIIEYITINQICGVIIGKIIQNIKSKRKNINT